MKFPTMADLVDIAEKRSNKKLRIYRDGRWHDATVVMKGDMAIVRPVKEEI